MAIARTEEQERKKQEMILKLLETSEEEPYTFLKVKPYTYEVAQGGTIPRFTKTILAQKASEFTMSELLHLTF